MVIALIVISAIAACGLIALFVCKYINFTRGGADGVKRKLTAADIKTWFINHAPSKRRLIQVYAMLLYNANIKGFVSGEMYAGNSKYMCVPGLNCYSCPGAVGACPLGALQNSLAASDNRAPFYMLGIIMLLGLICARTICGFLCPIGMCQELLYKVRTPKLKKSRVTRVLSYFKYFILVLTIALPIAFSGYSPVPAFCKYICPAGTFEGAIMLLSNPANAGDLNRLHGLFAWKFGLLIAFAVASMFIFRVFCRFICPLGAIYGFFNKFALIGVMVKKDDCTSCGLCVSHCKMDIKHVGDHECINCGECIAVCPTKAISWKGSRIFLRSSSIGETPAEEVKPIAVANGAAVLSGNTHEIDAKVNVDIAQTEKELTDMIIKASNPPDYTPNADTVDTVDTANTVEPNKTQKPRKKRGAKFWVEITAWIVAIALLATALIYYNAIDVEKPEAENPPSVVDPADPPSVTTGNKVGDIAPDFTVSIYGMDGEFNLYANRGKPVVLNFWGTWCGPCVQEMPLFCDLAYLHPELTVVAMHGSSSDDVWRFIQKKGWHNYPVTFTQDILDSDKRCLTFRAFGGVNAWPMTIIIDADGKIVGIEKDSYHKYEDLEKAVLDALGMNNE